MIKRNVKTGAAVVLAGALFAAGGMGTATAAKIINGSDIADNSITAQQLAGGSVGESELKNNVLKGIKGEKGDDGKRGPKGDTGPAGESGAAGAEGVRGLPGADGATGATGPAGPQGIPGAPGAPGAPGTPGAQGPQGPAGDPASDVAGTVAGYLTTDPALITLIGGTFSTRATQIGSLTLAAGEYVITGNAFFGSQAAVSGKTRLQLALRTAAGDDLGTCFTGATSTLANREITCSTTRVVELASETVVKVYAFGYADDQGSADSGKFGVQSFVTAVRA